MNNRPALTLTTPSEREIAMTRVFDVPRRRVWDALTRPDLLRRRLFGPDGWSLAACGIDLKPSGAYRYAWRHHVENTRTGVRGVFREVVPQERLVATDKFDESWDPGVGLTSTVLVERDGKTTLTLSIL